MLGFGRMFDENENQNTLRDFYFNIVHLKLEMFSNFETMNIALHLF